MTNFKTTKCSEKYSSVLVKHFALCSRLLLMTPKSAKYVAIVARNDQTCAHLGLSYLAPAMGAASYFGWV